MKDKLTQKRLKEVLKYSPDTGIFTWKVSKANGKIKIGDVAGGLDNWGYHNITVDKNKYRTHRLVMLYMTGKFPKGLVDHLDGDSLNNKWGNLKDGTPSENSMNKRKQSNNTSGVTGVVWNKRHEKWQVRIMKQRKNYNLGYFDNFEDAKRVRKEAEIKFGFTKRHGK